MAVTKHPTEHLPAVVPGLYHSVPRPQARPVGGVSRAVMPTVAAVLASERQAGALADRLREFKRRVAMSKVELYTLLRDLLAKGKTIVGVGAPSRASSRTKVPPKQ